MARLDDLVRQVQDPRLRREMEQALATLKRTQRFGLVYEEHLPETTALPGVPILPGTLVVRRDAPAGGYLRVMDVHDDGTALVVPARLTDDPDDAPQEMVEVLPVPVRELMAVKGFGETIYAGLTPLGTVERGGADRPHHAVVNAENFHGLQLLRFLYEGQVDCLYLDPPYNTGARDWKYNNDYVDGTDAWRHSKWLSYMEKRLRLAKTLLKPDGVLIVTIDENEVDHLSILLKSIFPQHLHQKASIVINPSGVSSGVLSRVDEYALFCFPQGFIPTPHEDDFLTYDPSEPEDGVSWESLLRRGNAWASGKRKNLCYPVHIDPKTGKIVGTGKSLRDEEKEGLIREDFPSKTPDGLDAAWPIRTDGKIGIWRVDRRKLQILHSKGFLYASQKDERRGTWSLKYLMEGTVDKINSGEIIVVGSGSKGEVLLEASSQRNTLPKTVWKRGRHTAGGAGGTQILNAFLSDKGIFSFPKSVYAVQDTLRLAVGNRPDALIVDVFAGSGTTLHATALLNAHDGGRRRCVLVTNNEVSEEDTKALHAAGHYRGDAAFEARGIFERATRPRVEAALSGVRPDGTPVPGAYLDGRPYAEGLAENAAFFRLDYLDPLAVEAGQAFDAIVPLLWLAAGGVGAPEYGAETRGQPFTLPDGSTYGVLLRETAFRAFVGALAARADVTHVWLVTDSEASFAEMRSLLPASLTVGMLYRDYLANFRLNTTTPR